MERTYAAALERLDTALTSGIHPSLDGIRALCAALGDPQHRFVSVQVAGTNGKTSTVRYLEALLRAEGMRTGLYTSPHLERYPERIELGGTVASDETFAEAVWAAVDAAERLRPDTLGTPEGFTEFELLTAGALWLFAREAVDVAVLEVGLGGRWDATTVVDPAVAVVTGIGLDHVHILGDTLEAIAAEKAGIIKPASTPVLGPGTAVVEQVLLDRVAEVGGHARAVREFGEPSPVVPELTACFRVTRRPLSPLDTTAFAVHGVHADYDGLEIHGPAYQAGNAATALAAAEAALGRALRVDTVRAALAETRIPGRFEVVGRDPLAVVDGSHNPEAAGLLAETVAAAWPDPARRPTVLLGVLADKDARGMVEALAPVVSHFAVTAPASPRALAPDLLADIVDDVTGSRPAVFSGVSEALEALIAGSPDGFVVTGSLVTAGEARTRLL